MDVVDLLDRSALGVAEHLAFIDRTSFSEGAASQSYFFYSFLVFNVCACEWFIMYSKHCTVSA
jgi:hypothetical protein